MRKLKLFFACLLMAVLSIGQVWGESVTFSSVYSDKTKPTSYEGTDFTIAFSKGTNSNNAPQYYATGTAMRCYGGNTLTISSSTKTIEGVAFTFSSGEGSNAITASTGTYSDGTWEGSATEITFTIGGTSGHRRIASVEVTFASGGTPTPTLSVSPAVIDFGTVDQNVSVAAQDVTVTFENLTGSVTYSGLSGAFAASGTIAATGNKITITPNTANTGNFQQTLTVQSAADSKSAEVTVKMNVVEPFDGLKLDFVLSANNLSLPTAKGSSVAGNYTYTIGTTDYTFYATDAQGTSDGGIYFGGSYTMIYASNALGLPAISGYKLVKVEASNSSGCSTTTAVSIREGQTSSDDIVSGGTAQTWGTQGSKYTYNLTGTEENTMYYLYVATKNCQLTGLSLYYEEVETPLLPKAAKPTFESGDENFVTSTSVTLACATEGASIYYTTNGDVPTSGNTLYEGAIPVNTTTTIKAIAVADGYDNSLVAEKTFTQVTALESLAALLEATVSAETAFNVVIDNWVVTGVNGTRAWISDAANEKGILLYKSGHNFTAGNKLNGVVIGTKTKLYQGYPEMTTLVSTDVTVTTAEAVTPHTTTIAALTSGYPNEQGTVVKLENLTYTAASTSLSDGVNSIQTDNKFYSASLIDGATYNLTGVVEYLDGPVVKIMPRSADDVEQISGGGLPEVNGLAELKAETVGTSYLVTLTDAVVTLVDGNNAFIQDATAGALIYFSGHGLAAGDKLNGQYEVTTATYQGKFEITAMTAQDGATKTADAEIPVTTLTISQLAANFAANESKRIKIVGVNVTDAIANNDRNGQISDGENTFALYAGKNGIAAAENDNIDIIGYPTFFNEAHQFNVWAQADITVNVKEDPELAYNPAVVNVLLSDLASFTPAVLEYATGFDGVAAITYESSDPNIATVGETTGVVEVVATAEGSATITATFGGNSTYKADNASYTINVSAAPIAPVYTMSFDMTRASYDAAADAQVVWNSSVVTMTANKNDGTKVTNYLAGNYSGTTLIAETRLYAKNSISFVPQAGVTITKIEWMSTAKGYATKLAAETFVNATAAVDGTDDKLVIITPSAAGEISVTLTDAARATGVTVYYEAESEKAKLDASISIANINTAVGEDDILLSDIAATSNPNKKAISYAITSGTAVSLVGEGKDAAFHAVEEGTATITATIPDNLGNYTGASTTFNIVVAAAPATLVSIAISGEATALEYTEGQDFNPAGLAVTGTYSDASTAPITEGITWAFDPSPLTAGTTSVSVTATVGEISSDAVVVNGLTVSAAAAPTVDNVVILATYGTKLYAMSTTLSSSAFTAIEVEEDGSNIVVPNADAKAAIQWTRTTSGENTTFQDADSKYMAGGTGNTNMSLADDPFNWSWNATDSYYYIGTTRSFFYYKSGVFKNYSIGNAGGDDYSGFAEVRVIDPANIVITAKVSAELAYDPESDEITEGDAWSAPTLVNPYSVTITSYASDNEAVATVEGGVIALAGGIGTAHITAHFDGDATYLEGDAVYTITVNAAPEPAEDCDGSDDFLDTEDKGNPTSYKDRSTPNGWSAVNAGYKVIDEKAYWMINGKTTAVGVITSPELAGGLGSLKFRYANTNSESNGVSVKIEIKQGGDVVKEYTLTKPNSEVVQNTVYTELIENINVAGTFQIVITNLSPSNNTGNKDRVSIGRFCWSSYSTPEPPVVDYTTVRTGLIASWYYTMCLDKAVTAVQGASIWRVLSKAANGTDVILEEVLGTLDAGRPYIFFATDDKLKVAYTGDAVDDPLTEGNNGLIGSFTQAHINNVNTNYIIYNNALYYVNTDNVYVGANRAYLDMTAVPDYQEPQQGNAPRRRVTMAVYGEQTATGIDALNAAEAPVKVMINGQIFILRGEKMYDATGRLVK